MSLARKYYLTDADEAHMLANILAIPYDDIHRRRRKRGEARFELGKRFPDLRSDQHQGNHSCEWDMQVLDAEIRLIDVALSAIEPIRVGMNRIDERHLEKPRFPGSLLEVYDLYASELSSRGQPLTEPLLKEGIPSLVFSAAVDFKWIPYPLRRPKSGPDRDFLEGWHRPFYYRTKRNGLTEFFGAYKVPKGFGAWFKEHLQTRTTHWRAEASKRQGQAKSANKRVANLKPNDFSAPVSTPNANGKKRNPSLHSRDAVIEQNPTLSARELCGLFDHYNVQVPTAWTKASTAGTWVEGYRKPKLRSRIDTLISKTRRRLQ